MLRKKISIITFSLLSFSTLWATDDYSILGKNGKNLFDLTFFDKGEQAEIKDSSDSDNPTTIESTYSLNSAEKKGVLDAFNYHKDILNSNNNLTSKIFIYTIDDFNAFASSSIIKEGEGKGMTELQARLLGKKFDSSIEDPVTIIGIGNMNFKVGTPSGLPNVDGADLFGTIVHEIGHAIGISGTAHFDEDIKQVKFSDVLSKFDEGLVDNSGRKISETTGNIYFIDENGHEIGDKYTDFDASGKVYFVGKNVADVLGNSTLKGVPINTTLEYDEEG